MLIALLVVAGLAAGADWWSRVTDKRAVELVSKPLATVALGGVAVVCADRGDVGSAALGAVIIGFVCCLIGDVALLPAVDRFVVGLAAFLVGHVAFVVMFVLLGLDRWWLGAVALVAAVAVALVLGRRIVSGARVSDPSLAMPVQAYLAVILSMAVVGWATGRPAAMAGAALFVSSDSILGWRQFVEKRRWMPMVIMVTYHLALLGLALSLAD